MSCRTKIASVCLALLSVLALPAMARQAPCPILPHAGVR